MPTNDPRIDAYIAKSADFAKPILRELRQRIHASCPQVEETIKWGMPHFMYKGLLCGIAAFKQHCACGFWHTKLLDLPSDKSKDAMGQLGRIRSLADLPSKSIFAGWVKQTVKLRDEGVKPPGRPKKKRAPLKIPGDLLAALKKNKKAQAAFEEFSFSHKKEYVEWITEAKREETRQKRLATTIEWLTQGKSRNWKYENC